MNRKAVSFHPQIYRSPATGSLLSHRPQRWLGWSETNTPWSEQNLADCRGVWLGAGLISFHRREPGLEGLRFRGLGTEGLWTFRREHGCPSYETTQRGEQLAVRSPVQSRQSRCVLSEFMVDPVQLQHQGLESIAATRVADILHEEALLPLVHSHATLQIGHVAPQTVQRFYLTACQQSKTVGSHKPPTCLVTDTSPVASCSSSIPSSELSSFESSTSGSERASSCPSS